MILGSQAEHSNHPGQGSSLDLAARWKHDTLKEVGRGMGVSCSIGDLGKRSGGRGRILDSSELQSLMM
jgi:hypothetical protein